MHLNCSNVLASKIYTFIYERTANFLKSYIITIIFIIPVADLKDTM